MSGSVWLRCLGASAFRCWRGVLVTAACRVPRPGRARIIAAVGADFDGAVHCRYWRAS